MKSVVVSGVSRRTLVTITSSSLTRRFGVRLDAACTMVLILILSRQMGFHLLNQDLVIGGRGYHLLKCFYC